MKAFGKLTPMSNQPMLHGEVKPIAYQIMTPEQIKEGKVDEIKEVMERSENQGMKTFDSALYDLYKAGQITLEEAMKNADSKNNLRLKIQLSEGKKASADEDEGGLSLEPKDEGRHGH
jgi:twitching motility protein PilU